MSVLSSTITQVKDPFPPHASPASPSAFAIMSGALPGCYRPFDTPLLIRRNTADPPTLESIPPSSPAISIFSYPSPWRSVRQCYKPAAPARSGRYTQFIERARHPRVRPVDLAYRRIMLQQRLSRRRNLLRPCPCSTLYDCFLHLPPPRSPCSDVL